MTKATPTTCPRCGYASPNPMYCEACGTAFSATGLVDVSASKDKRDPLANLPDRKKKPKKSARTTTLVLLLVAIVIGVGTVTYLLLKPDTSRPKKPTTAHKPGETGTKGPGGKPTPTPAAGVASAAPPGTTEAAEPTEDQTTPTGTAAPLAGLKGLANLIKGKATMGTKPTDGTPAPADANATPVPPEPEASLSAEEKARLAALLAEVKSRKEGATTTAPEPARPGAPGTINLDMDSFQKR